MKIYSPRQQPDQILCECMHSEANHQSAFASTIPRGDRKCHTCMCPKFEVMENDYQGCILEAHDESNNDQWSKSK